MTWFFEQKHNNFSRNLTIFAWKFATFGRKITHFLLFPAESTLKKVSFVLGQQWVKTFSSMMASFLMKQIPIMTRTRTKAAHQTLMTFWKFPWMTDHTTSIEIKGWCFIFSTYFFAFFIFFFFFFLEPELESELELLDEEELESESDELELESLDSFVSGFALKWKHKKRFSGLRN